MSSLHDWRPDLEIAPPRFLLAALALFHGILLWLVLAWSVSWSSKAILGLLILASFAYLIATQRPSGGHFVSRLCWGVDGWMLTTQRGLVGPLMLGNGSRLGKHFFILHFRVPSVDQRFSRFSIPWLVGLGRALMPARVVILCRDQLPREDFERFQIFLRWQRQSVVNPSPDT
ncbi:MAG: hypothetical protein MI976_21965 [Pseudomonadales bacterium]|nr:hypothetical protein [Pseudomonadales bacterium]